MGLRVRHSTDSGDRTAGGRGSWKLEVKVGSLQKSNITRAADRDGVTNCNRRVRKMHRRGDAAAARLKGPYHFGVTNGIRMTQASYWICGGSVSMHHSIHPSL